MKFKITIFDKYRRETVLREYILHFLNLRKAEKFSIERLEKDEGYGIEDLTPGVLDYE